MLENKVNQTSFKSTRRKNFSIIQLKKLVLNLRGMMPWITENRLVDKDKN